MSKKKIPSPIQNVPAICYTHVGCTFAPSHVARGCASAEWRA